MNRARHGIVFCFGVAAAAGFGGCSSLEPWVPPYERGLLVDPIMSVSRNPIAEKHRQHVFDTREAARGAVTTEGGGCGCN
jgi:hypothetical protein